MNPVGPERVDVAVVGGGLAGLGAAWQVAAELPGARVVVLEGSRLVGGKLRGATVAGTTLDAGAESMLARRPEALELACEVGLADDLVNPATTRASVWSHGALHPLPPGTLMGVPGDLAAAAGILSPNEIVAETRADPPAGDVSVGGYLAPLVGDGVVDRLVEPLLGGVYAGSARALSLQATVPALWAAAREGVGPTAAARRATAVDPGARGPVFAGIAGGVHRLATALADRLAGLGVEVRTGQPVTALDRSGTGWRLRTGPAPRPGHLEAGAVVVAAPAAPSARLLADIAPGAAAVLARIGYASMALVTYAFPRSRMPRLPGSGLLVPAVERLHVKASTFSSAKWAWLDAADPEHVFVRVSFGRYDDVTDLQRTDDDLAALGLADLTLLLGAGLPEPAAHHVQRWGGGLPQYTVGHLDRVARVREAVGEVPGLQVCGAAYDGVGIPAVIGSARRAGTAVATHLRGEPAAARE